METTFEKLNDQEMINVVGGLERVVRYTDEHGNVFYIIIKEDVEEGTPGN
jgi:bacteriocin-like protein